MISGASPVASNLRTSAGTLAIAGLGALALSNIPLAPSAPPADLAALADWWDHVGTATAAMTLLRTVMLGVAGYVAVVSGLATLSGLLPHVRIARVWRCLAVPSLRRHLASSVLVVTWLTPGLAAAQYQEPIVIADIGSVDTIEPTNEAILIADFGTVTLGAADRREVADRQPSVEPGAVSSANQTPAVVDAWLVEPGDHLWKIAEVTLTQAGHSPTVPEIASYWHKIITANVRQLDGNPSLIHPGQIIALPAQPTAGS